MILYLPTFFIVGMTFTHPKHALYTTELPQPLRAYAWMLCLKTGLVKSEMVLYAQHPTFLRNGGWEGADGGKILWGNGLSCWHMGPMVVASKLPPLMPRLAVECDVSPNTLSIPLFITHPTAFWINPLSVPNVQCCAEGGKLRSHTWFAFNDARGPTVLYGKIGLKKKKRL